MSDLRVVRTRGGKVETVHRVGCAVVRVDRGLVARSGDPDAFTWWRSAAKPFQAIPLVEDGGADHFGLDTEELAITCASHSSEPGHLAVVDRLLAAIGCREDDLACGPHPPLSSEVRRALIREGQTPTPRWSNCSGKHAGMLALARHRGWPIEGYVRPDHPVQQRLLGVIAEWTGVAVEAITLGVDGCTTVCYGTPLRSMATAWARFGASTDPAPRRVREAMLAHPDLIAGTGRPCTAMMAAWPGKVVAKIGADGVYGAALPGLGMGVAIKVEDGDTAASALATVAVLRQLLGRWGGEGAVAEEAPLSEWTNPPILNTRGTPTGIHEVVGSLVFEMGVAANG
jgi:L-asparaginase II